MQNASGTNKLELNEEGAKGAHSALDVESLRAEIRTAVTRVRENNPLAGSVTNGVTMDFVANAQLAVGGSAAMVYLPDEAQGLVAVGGAAYANMGTLLPVHEETMIDLAKACYEAHKPLVLDPVGIGLGELREKILLGMKPYKPAIIRGNASEIIALAKLWDLNVQSVDAADALSAASDRAGADASADEGPRGVDSVHGVAAAIPSAVCLARYTGGAVSVSGEEDLITDGTTLAFSQGGSAFMSKITGFGCSLGGVTAVYATQTTPFVAALTAAAHYNCAGTQAQAQVEASKTNKANSPAAFTYGPGSFKVAFIDALYTSTAEEIAQTPLRVKEA